jgi:toxin ParE1/3/4
VSDQYRLTRRAEADLDDIAAYTLQHWGQTQMDAYIRALFDRFEWLASKPKVGRERPEIGRGVRSYPEGSHIVFYREVGTVIEIAAIPHQAMDVRSWFD